MAFQYGGTLTAGDVVGSSMEVDQNVPEEEDFDCLVYRSGTGDLVGPEARAASVDDYLYCKVCKANFMTVKTAMVHYNGKPHQRTLTAIAENMGVLNVPTLGKDGKAQKPQNQVVTATPRGGTLAGFVKPGESTPAFVEGRLANGIFVDEKGTLWGPEKNARTLGEFKTCVVCDVTASSFKTAKEHYQGGKHIKVLKKKAEENGLKYLSVGKKLYTAIAQGPAESDNDPLGLKADAEAEASQSANKRNYQQVGDVEVEYVEGTSQNGASKKPRKDPSEKYCDICQITLTSKIVADLHYAGKKHAKNVEKLTTSAPKAGSGKFTLDLASSIPFCQKCDVMCLSQEQLEEHMESAEHIAKVEEEKEQFQASVKSVTNKPEEPEYAYGCRICDIKVTSKDNYLQHMESKKHLKKFYALQEKKLEDRLKLAAPTGLLRPIGGSSMLRPFGPPPPPSMLGGKFGPRGPPSPPLGWGNSGPGWGSTGPRWVKDDYKEYEWKGSDRGGLSRGGPSEFPYRDVRLEDQPYFGSERRDEPIGGGRSSRGGPGGRGGLAGRGRGGSPARNAPMGGGRGPMDASGGGDDEFTSSILNMLPKEAVMKLAMEALSTKSKDILANVKQGGGEGGRNWEADDDYQSYNRAQGGSRNQWSSGRERGFEKF